jgi:hypothetical protein
VKQGRNAEAKALYQRALSIQEHLLGPKHPDTARTSNGLASLCMLQEKDEQAELYGGIY